MVEIGRAQHSGLAHLALTDSCHWRQTKIAWKMEVHNMAIRRGAVSTHVSLARLPVPPDAMERGLISGYTKFNAANDELSLGTSTNIRQSSRWSKSACIVKELLLDVAWKTVRRISGVLETDICDWAMRSWDTRTMLLRISIDAVGACMEATL